MTDGWDVVVVGGGSAGAVIATRLSDDPACRTLLLEAGPDPRPLPGVLAEAARSGEVEATDYVARISTARAADGSRFDLLAGRVMGGGSSVNVMATIRPYPADCARWAEAGGPDWAFERLEPLMASTEANLGAEPAFRFGQPVPPVIEAFLDAAVSAGIPTNEDMRQPDACGICAAPYAIRAGRRRSTTVAFLDPVRARPNLEVRPGCTVTAVGISGGRAQGVSYIRDGRMESVVADTVVLSAGVFGSPVILLRSGWTHPGVGANFQDHAVVDLWHEAGQADDGVGRVPRFRLVLRSDDELALPDLHVTVGGGSAERGRRVRAFSVRLLEQRTRGRVSLAPGDPLAPPLVSTGMLDDREDVEAIVRGTERLRELLEGAGPQWFGRPHRPGPGDDVGSYARKTFGSYDHGVGTCAMGPASDPGAVVDGRLRVHGLDGLWVADASVLPTIPHANPNLSVILVAELAARFLGER